MSQILLSIHNLSCERGYRQLFTGLNLDVSEGDVVRIAGANGTGKSTLLKLITGMSAHYEGEILWKGQSIKSVREEFLAALCFLGHDKAVKTSLTPLENLSWFASLYPCRTDLNPEEVLSELGIGAYKDIPCAQLSAGQKQRVALARLLLSDASLWVLDEPFTAIDKKGVAAFERVISDFAKRGGAVIVTTHHDLKLEGANCKVVDLEALP